MFFIEKDKSFVKIFQETQTHTQKKTCWRRREIKVCDRLFLEILTFSNECQVFRRSYLRIYLELCEIFNFFLERSVGRTTWDWPHRPIGRPEVRNRPDLLKTKIFWPNTAQNESSEIWPEMADIVRKCYGLIILVP